MIESGYDLYRTLQKLDLLKASPEFWWPNAYSFEVVVGAILTQNSQWQRVEQSLDNLRNNDLLSLEAIARAPMELLIECIRPSGFFKAKSKNIQCLCRNIIGDFGGFENFCCGVNREWLLEQRGIGFESADAILCYGCGRAVMVVDKYTQQLAAALGREFEDYHDLQAWCREGFKESDGLARELALFHGMIVEYMKKYKKGREIDLSPINETL
ncbi:3-methyladenine DNA glycosylase [Sulfurimonas sp. HSL3-7]